MKENLQLKGQIEAVLKKGSGDVEVRKVDNMIVDCGFDFVCNALANPTRPALLGYIAVGSGTDAVAAAQAQLATEFARVAAVYKYTEGEKVFCLESELPAGVATGAITEAGVFNAVADGIMFDRVVFNVINKEADDELLLRFKFKLSQPDV